MAVTGTGEDSLRKAEADFIVAVWGGGGFKRLRNRKCMCRKVPTGVELHVAS